MKVISAHPRLKAAAACLFFGVPLFVLHGMLVRGLPWWKLPLRGTAVSTAVLAAVCGFIAWKILSARIWAVTLLGALGVLWLCVSVGEALAMKRPSLGFFSLGLVLYLGPLTFLIRQELGKSFMDPMLHWYQGAPPAIPQLHCQLSAPDGTKHVFRVSRLDHEGVFMVAGGARAPKLRWPRRQAAEMIFSFRDRSAPARGRAAASCLDGQAIGIRFEGMSPDSGKDLGEFIEKLKGEGYV